MQKTHSPEYPFGYNESKFNPKIPFYLSLAEVVEICRTNQIRIDGKLYLLPDDKAKKPVFTYKGDYGNYRSNENFKGERSPYIGIDIDIIESCDVKKSSLTGEQRLQIDQDIALLRDFLSGELSGGKRNIFFCKKSCSGCGLHIMLKLTDVPAGQTYLYEREIFHKFQESINSIQPTLHFKYSVDDKMLSSAQGFHFSSDPEVICNPESSTPASHYTLTLKPEYGESGENPSSVAYTNRSADEIDRLNFTRFELFCKTKELRMSYQDIWRLSIIFLQIWPDATCDEFSRQCAGFNSERSKKRGASSKFFSGLYKSIKRNARNQEYKGMTVTVNSLLFIMNQYGYEYQPNMELHFKGYLSNLTAPLFDAFETNSRILLESPTGSGKTRLLFEWAKQQALKYPYHNHVIALPYTCLVEQFALENSDERFSIRTFLGGKSSFNPGLVMVDDSNGECRSKVSGAAHPIFDLQPDSLISNQKPTISTLPRKKPKKIKGKKALQPHPNPVIPECVSKMHNIICTTYDSAHRISGIQTLVIDEAHDMVKQLDFRPEALNSLERINSKKTIYVTATPDALLPEVEDYFHIRCVKDDSKKPNLSIEKVKGSIIEALKDRIRKSPSSLSFLNDKQGCAEIKNSLWDEDIALGIYSADSKREEHQKHLEEEGIIGAHSIATSYLMEGISVRNSDIAHILIVDDNDIDNIRQKAARPRLCSPEVRLILPETNYAPADGDFSRTRTFQKKINYLQTIVGELNSIQDQIKGDQDGNRFQAFDEELKFLYKDRGQFRIHSGMVKMEINTNYKRWLYHRKRDLWMENIQRYFTVIGTTLTENDKEDPKRKEISFEAFKLASHSGQDGQDIIALFDGHNHACELYKNKKKKNPDLRPKYSSEMKAWAEDNDRIQLHKMWKKWSDRYMTMKKSAYPVDFDVVYSTQKFSRWEQRVNMEESVCFGGDTAKEKRIESNLLLIVDFLLGLNVADHNYTTKDLFDLTKLHLNSKKKKMFTQKPKAFIAALGNVIKINSKRVRSASYVRSIEDIRSQSPYTKERKGIEEWHNKEDAQSNDPF